MRLTGKVSWGLALVAALCASVWLAAPAGAKTAAAPHALKLLINGKQLPITPFAGPDHYNAVNFSKLKVVARWKGSLTGSGYKVQISTTEPTVRTWRTCSTGTSCALPKRVPILNGEQMSWIVRVEKTRHHFVKIVGGFMVCLARHAHPA
jgi:hypothetical protein